MWVSVIDVLLARALEMIGRRQQPRARLSRALKRLLASLEDCHASYREFKVTDSSGAGRRHREAVCSLIRRLWRLRDVLGVFAPDVLLELQRYTVTEVEQWAPEDVFYEVWSGKSRAEVKRLMRPILDAQGTPKGDEDDDQDEDFASRLAPSPRVAAEDIDPEVLCKIQYTLSGYKYTSPVAPLTEAEQSLDYCRLGRLTAWAWGGLGANPASPDYGAAVHKLTEFTRQHTEPEDFL